jgi:hypothetical protein
MKKYLFFNQIPLHFGIEHLHFTHGLSVFFPLIFTFIKVTQPAEGLGEPLHCNHAYATMKSCIKGNVRQAITGLLIIKTDFATFEWTVG